MDFGSGNNIFNKRSIALALSKYSKILTIFLLLIIFSSSFIFIIGPKYKKMKSVSNLLTIAKTDELQRLEIYLDRLKKFNKSYKDVSVLDREKINKTIPEDIDRENLITMVEDLVKNRGLTLQSIRIGKEKISVSRRKKAEKEPGISENIGILSFAIEIPEMDYEMAKKLIIDFEKNLRIMDIQSVEFSEGASLILEINSYYFKS